MNKMLEKVMEKRTAKEMCNTMKDKNIRNIRNYRVIAGLQELACILDEAKMLSNELAEAINELDEKEIKELQNLNIDVTTRVDGEDIIKLARG